MRTVAIAEEQPGSSGKCLSGICRSGGAKEERVNTSSDPAGKGIITHGTDASFGNRIGCNPIAIYEESPAHEAPGILKGVYQYATFIRRRIPQRRLARRFFPSQFFFRQLRVPQQRSQSIQFLFCRFPPVCVLPDAPPGVLLQQKAGRRFELEEHCHLYLYDHSVLAVDGTLDVSRCVPSADSASFDLQGNGSGHYRRGARFDGQRNG